MNELDRVQNNLPAVTPTTNNFNAAPGGVTVQNNYGTITQQIDQAALSRWFGSYVEQVAQQITGHLTAQTAPPPSHAIEWANLSRERYCLFVLENENYKTGSFSIPIRKALKYTDESTRNSLIGLSSADQETIKSMPCIFAIKNKTFKHAPDGIPFIVGRVTEIAIQGDNIKFSFVTFRPAKTLNIPAFEQRILNENVKALKLKERSYNGPHVKTT